MSQQERLMICWEIERRLERARRAGISDPVPARSAAKVYSVSHTSVNNLRRLLRTPEDNLGFDPAALPYNIASRLARKVRSGALAPAPSCLL
jgi:hypothetical protein